LYNRRCLNAQLQRFMERASGSPAGGGLAVLVLDLDRFKQVNDTWGHAAGDTVLVRVGAAIRSHVRKIDLPCRVGGDEFLVLLAGLLRSAGVRAIYTSDAPRAVETARPLAADLGLQPTALASKTPDELDAAIVAAMRKDHAGDVVLVVGHTDIIPGLLRALGAE